VKPLERAFEAYRRLLIPDDASAQEVAKERRAFLAGATVLHTTLMRSLSPGPGVSRGDERLMTELIGEMQEFGRALDIDYLGPLVHEVFRTA